MDKKIKILNIVGARPNFMKISPIIDEMKKHPDQIEPILVHTGQHYDEKMSKLFFEDLGMPEPDIYMGVGSGSHAEQTAKIMIDFEKIIIEEKPDLVLVVGDVNSTIACALTASKLGVKIAHVEAGLRSFDREMPEEINRILTDQLSDFLFLTEKSAKVNLLNEGKREDQIHFVGNVMIDTLLKNKERSDKSNIIEQLSLKKGEYALLTMHRPSNVDNDEVFNGIITALVEISKQIKIVFPVHPRTKKQLSKLDEGNIEFTEPLGYLDFLKLMTDAKLMLTDSGGIQEETTILGVPCLTMRKNTERPITIDEGTNILVGVDKDAIISNAMNVLNGEGKRGSIPEKWDGQASKRIIEILLDKL